MRDKISWEIIKDKTQDHWLEVKGDDGSRQWHAGEKEKDGIPIYPYHAIAKWDGCVIFTDYSNGYGYGHIHDDSCEAGSGCCEESFHICDIDSMITYLQELKNTAAKFFKGKSGEEYWSKVDELPQNTSVSEAKVNTSEAVETKEGEG